MTEQSRMVWVLLNWLCVQGQLPSASLWPSVSHLWWGKENPCPARQWMGQKSSTACFVTIKYHHSIRQYSSIRQYRISGSPMGVHRDGRCWGLSVVKLFWVSPYATSSGNSSSKIPTSSRLIRFLIPPQVGTMALA